jgi:copper resistance protein D
MSLVAELLDTFLRAAVLVGVSLVLGGVVWALAVLRPWQLTVPDAAIRRAATIVATGAVIVAAGQTLLLVAKALVLSETFGRTAVADFAATLHFTASTGRVLIAGAVAGAVLWLRRALRAPRRWGAVTVLAALLTASGAWLTHATGRLDDRATLMALTAFHQAGVAVWLGGLVQLAACWRLSRYHPAVDALWATLLGRFSRLALGSVVLLVLSALPLAWMYTGSIGGLVGTGYGTLILTKTALLGAVLWLAARNRHAVRQAREAPLAASLRARLPYLVEAEVIVLAMIVLTAVTLSAQPPAVDVASADRATLDEVLEVFRPKLPSLYTPSIELMRQSRAAAAQRDRERSVDAYRWSNYSHNVAGLILLGTSAVALVGAIAGAAGWRHWPLGLVPLAAFVYLRASANEGTWPFGPVPLWTIDAEGLQHRGAAVLVLALGVLEWRVRRRPHGGRLAYMFPVLAAAGAILLLTHSHTAFQTRQSFLVQVTHTTMGALAAVLVAARWLELRVSPPAGRFAGVAASLAMLMIALILLFYREANVVLPPNSSVPD